MTTESPKISPDSRAMSLSTRDRLIEVGLDLMRQQGYGATGLQEILQAAAIPKGSFYHYFESKEAFATAVLNRYVSLEEKRCQEVLGNTRQAPLKRLRRYFDDLIERAGQSAPVQGCLMGSLCLEVARNSSLLQACISTSFAHWQASIASVLGEAISRGDLPRSTKTEALAGFMLNSWEGALLRSQADRSDAPLKDFLHFTFAELLATSA